MTYEFEDFELDADRGELRKHGQAVEIHATPLRVLVYLVENRDRIVPKRELLDKLWPDTSVGEAALTTALKEVRQAIGDSGQQARLIRTERGRGYRFIAAVQESSSGTPAVTFIRRGWQIIPSSGLVAVLLLVAWFGLRFSPDFSTPIRSLAVLPLQSLPAEPEQEYFSDGMTERLIGQLGKLSSLRVISRTSVGRYKGTDKTAREIAEELQVEGLIEGSVLKDRDRVRITLQLIDARTDAHVWTGSYERDLEDVLALQREIARAVAQEIEIELSADEEEALTASRPIDPAAYDAFVRGRSILDTSSFALGVSASEAIPHFEAALELDPGFAEAWADLSLAHGVAARFSRSSREPARLAAQRALELDAQLSDAHRAMGWCSKTIGTSRARADTTGER